MITSVEEITQPARDTHIYLRDTRRPVPETVPVQEYVAYDVI